MYRRQTFTDCISSRDTQERFSLRIRPCWSDRFNEPYSIVDLSSAAPGNSVVRLTNRPVGFPSSSLTISPPSIVAGKSPRSFKMAGETHSA